MASWRIADSIGILPGGLDPFGAARQNPGVHPIDRLATILMRLDRGRLGIFPEGWGDTTTLEMIGSPPRPEDPIPELDVVWGRKEEHRGLRVRRGTFASPVSDRLPLECRPVPIEVVEPAAGTDRMVLLMAAWNDHGFATRRKLVALLAERGIGAAMVDIPFYGDRRLTAHPAQAIRTVANFMVMGHGALHEARALLAMFRSSYTPGVSGYSMGGNMAALVSASMPFPVATAPHAASHSPGPVYLDGVLSTAVDWSALGGGDARDRLRTMLSAVTVLATDPLPHHAAAVLVAARKDGFVPVSATKALHRHWTGSELIWVDAGHASLLGRHRPELADSVVRAFDRLGQS